MRKVTWSSRAGAARANPAIGLLLLGAVVAIIVTLLNRDSGSERDTRTGANYLEQARAATAIDPALVTWEEAIEPIDVPMDSPVAIAIDPADRPGWVFVIGDRLVMLNTDRSEPQAPLRKDFRSDPFPEGYRALTVSRIAILAATSARVDLLELIADPRDSSPTQEEASLTILGKWEYGNSTGVGFTSIAAHGGEVFIADALGKRVWKHPEPHPPLLRESEKQPEIVAEGFNVPSTMDITVTRDGELVTVDPGRHQVQVRDAYGDVVRSFGENGNRIDQFHGCCNPIAIALLSDGRWVTAEKGLGVTRVKVYSAEGEFESVVAGPDQFDEPKNGPPIRLDLAVDSKDRILVLDPVRKQVRTFTPKGESK